MVEQSLMKSFDDEYKKAPCFWGVRPAKYVRLLVDEVLISVMGLRILDLGAGEGKNAVYLAGLGAKVTGIDISNTALERFALQPGFFDVKHRLEKKCVDVRDYTTDNNSFDIVIAYGLLHCLPSNTCIENELDRYQMWVRSGGYMVVATFTNEIPPPTIQPYLLEAAFLPQGRLQQLFEEWNIIHTEDEIITESHPTNQIPHNHSICRLIARKPFDNRFN